VRKSAADATTTILKTLGTFWLNIPSPKVSNLAGPELTGAAAPANLQASGAAGVLQGNLGYLTILAAVVGLIVCGARLGITGRSEHGSEAVKMLVRLVAVTAAGAGIVDILIKAGDVFSPWIISSATGAPFDQTAPSLLTNEGLLAMTPLLTIIVAIFALFGAGAMVIFMILRGALLIILIAVWPLSASLTSTEQGVQWYKKINAYLIAFVLLRPVASIIYAAGYLLIKDGHDFQTTDPGVSALMASLTGMAILAVAGLSLPALLRFVAPATAAGSGAMTGAAVMGAAVAVGAAAVTMGAGAAAGGAGAGAGGASGGGASGAASASSGGAGAAAGGGGGVEVPVAAVPVAAAVAVVRPVAPNPRVVVAVVVAPPVVGVVVRQLVVVTARPVEAVAGTPVEPRSRFPQARPRVAAAPVRVAGLGAGRCRRPDRTAPRAGRVRVLVAVNRMAPAGAVGPVLVVGPRRGRHKRRAPVVV